jgi:hypothetical protein
MRIIDTTKTVLRVLTVSTMYHAPHATEHVNGTPQADSIGLSTKAKVIEPRRPSR